MSGQYDNTNRWTLNKNSDKQEKTHADYKGSINVNGVEYWLNGWIKNGPNGPFISGTLKPKEKKYPADRITTGRQLPPKQNILPDDGEEIPF